MAGPIRVVVADDSALMRQIVSGALSRGGVEIVGTACDGDEALAICERQRPDTMTLDLAMPGLDGLGVLKALRAKGGSFPVVVVSAFSPSQGARAVDALAEGAFDLVAKPAVGESLDGFAASLVEKIRIAAAAGRNGHSRPSANGLTLRPRPAIRTRGGRAVVIATSTGGPRALAQLLPALPSPLGNGTMIVQHMPAGFTGSLAARLDRASRLNVSEAQNNELPDSRRALVAPGGRHLRLGNDGRTVLSDEPEIGGLRPRADLLIRDAARVYRDRLLLVVMTGMGSDGLDGAREVRRLGGQILVEAAESCTVYGMPRAVVEAKLADEILPLDKLAGAIAAEAC